MNTLGPETVGHLTTFIKVAIVTLVQVLIFSILYRRMQIQKKSHRGDNSFKTYRQLADSKRGRGKRRDKGGVDDHHNMPDFVNSSFRDMAGQMSYLRKHH